MAYNNVFMLEDGDKVLGLYTSYDKAVSAVHKAVSEGDPRDSTPFIQVWKNMVHYDEGRRPSKGWTWREFLMVRHLYTPDSLR